MKKLFTILLAVSICLSVWNVPIRAASNDPAPVSLKSVTSTSDRLYVKWQTRSDVTGYHIRIGTDKDFTFSKLLNNYFMYDPGRSQFDRKVGAGQPVWVKIRTFNKVGDKFYYSEWSNVITHTTGGSASNSKVPDAVKLISVDKSTSYNPGVKAKWETRSGVTGYHIRIGTDKDFTFSKLLNNYFMYGASKSQFERKTASGQKVWVKVRAFNKVGDTFYYSPWSNVITQQVTAVKGYKLSKSSVTLSKVGATAKIQLNKINGSKTTKVSSGVTFKSSNTKVAAVSVSGGVCTIKAKGEGTATITATYKGKKYTCKVTVIGSADQNVDYHMFQEDKSFFLYKCKVSGTKSNPEYTRIEKVKATSWKCTNERYKAVDVPGYGCKIVREKEGGIIPLTLTLTCTYGGKTYTQKFVNCDIIS